METPELNPNVEINEPDATGENVPLAGEGGETETEEEISAEPTEE